MADLIKNASQQLREIIENSIAGLLAKQAVPDDAPPTFTI